MRDKRKPRWTDVKPDELLKNVMPAIREAWTRDRCGACGQFLRSDSTYSNRCSDCWTEEDEFLW